MRRFTRLTNAFSKKLENHAAMVSLYFMYYNVGADAADDVLAALTPQTPTRIRLVVPQRRA